MNYGILTADRSNQSSKARGNFVSKGKSLHDGCGGQINFLSAHLQKSTRRACSQPKPDTLYLKKATAAIVSKRSQGCPRSTPCAP